MSNAFDFEVPASEELEVAPVYPLEAREIETLTRCEAVIARGVQTFIEVGEALAVIRDGKLYRADFTTFEHYCRNKWGIGDSRARQLIGAANVAREIESVTAVTIPSERAARELAKAAPEDRPRVIERAAELSGDQSPTTKHIAQAAAEIAAPAPSLLDLGDMLLRLDAHGYARTGTRQKGMTTFYSFRDYRGGHDESGGELELAEGELSFWLAELDSNAAYAQAKQEKYLGARDRAERLGYDLRRDGTQFVLSIAGQTQPALRGTIDAIIKTIAGYEKNAAKQSAALPPLPSEDEQHAETIKAILREAEDKGERTGTRLYQQAYDHAREIHDWTEDRPGHWRSACGIASYTGAPQGSTDGGHCSSCVRAGWTQNQTEQKPAAPEVASAPDLSRYGYSARVLPDGRIAIHTPGNLETEHTREGLANLIALWDAYPPIPADLARAGVVWRYRSDRMVQVMCGDTIGQTGYSTAECLANQRDYMQRTGQLAAPAAEADESAIKAQIRSKAERLGLQMIWEEGKVLMYWPDEADDIEQMDLLDYGVALEWLDGDGLSLAALRAEEREKAPTLAEQYEAQEQADLILIAKADQAIASGDTDRARDLLSQVQVATYRRDQPLQTIATNAGGPLPAAPAPARAAGCRIEIAFTSEECAALLKEARWFSGSELTKKLPTIGQTLVLLIEAIKG